ncbi:DNA polymerase III subunit beta [Halorhodospira abdelmalekii]|uniref:DNA polymerase III subunit beta n=1 Tax=Halorhodospira abdelmalekii TaxID=421629 RepID=UPI001904DFB9|nr:DNA polymerase III subunit beta [Halorhodospira abdelmalekii]MBK1733698.1 DNA polymerase III subunit beta [Halorhodospira abdelmalekii]
MKLQLERNTLLPLLQQLVSIVERKQTDALLANIRLEATAEQAVYLTSSDMEVELVAKLNGVVEKPGITTLPARKWLDICRNLPDQSTLEIFLEGNRAQLRCGRGRFALATLEADEFPEVELSSEVETVVLPQDELRGVIERSHFSMASQDVRYALNGLLIELTGRGIRAVATDGHRLALAEGVGEIEVTQPRQVIVPRKGVHELLRILGTDSTPLQLQLDSNHIRVEVGDVRITSKLIDGLYPDYYHVLPEKNEKHLTLAREALRQAVSRVAILSNEKSRGVRFQLRPHLLSIGSHNYEQEEAEEELEVDYSGEEVEIGFNANYLLDALGAMETEHVVISLNDSKSSGLFRPEGDERTRYVIMPMQI